MFIAKIPIFILASTYLTPIFGNSSETGIPPLVFVYTLIPRACHLGLPDYFVSVLRQAHFIYGNGSIVLLTNYQNCSNFISKADFFKTTDTMKYIQVLDTNNVTSFRTSQFYDRSMEMFKNHPDPWYKPGLWVASTLRFFILEDFMHQFHYTTVIHLESDIMIYGPWKNEVVTNLINNYKDLAATRLSSIFFTASVFWVSNTASLNHFTTFLDQLVNGTEVWNDYLDYLRGIPNIGKSNGLGADKNGHGGIKPTAVCEMSMLVYYSDRYKGRLISLPIIPKHYIITDFRFNKSDYAAGGRHVGAGSSNGVYDPNSYGQYLGGTGTGKAAKFIDSTHYIGNMLRWHGCEVRMLCDVERCHTAPFVRCSGDDKNASRWTILYNLHVHSKKTSQFLSLPCPCNTPLPD